MLTPGIVTATSINEMLTDQTAAVAKDTATPVNATLPLVNAASLLLFRLSSQIPSRITKAPAKAVAVTGSPSRNVAQAKLNSGYDAASGTATETPTDFNPYK